MNLFLGLLKQHLNLDFSIRIKVQLVQFGECIHGVNYTTNLAETLMNKGLLTILQASKCAGGSANNRCQLTPAINQFHCAGVNTKQRSSDLGQTNLP